EVLGFDEEAAVAILESFEQEGGGQSGLADPGGADKHEILLLGDEVEVCALADGGGVNAGLHVEGEGLQGPALGQAGPVDAVGEAALAHESLLLSQDARIKLGVAGFGLLGADKLALDGFA